MQVALDAGRNEAAHQRAQEGLRSAQIEVGRRERRVALQPIDRNEALDVVALTQHISAGLGLAVEGGDLGGAWAAARAFTWSCMA
ncbi:hypothetical protein ACRAWD_19825 [Caulobacter segnis]